jgi:AhpD family alkylhydroperoxidase
MLTEKELELIAVGASIASGCRPCTMHHFGAARIAGASEDEIRQAVDDALGVRGAATEVMARLGNHRAANAVPAGAGTEETSLLRELVSLSAAYAVNCVATLDAHLGVARRYGASNETILAALKVACAIKDMAGKKVQAAATRSLGEEESDGDACGCRNDGEPGDGPAKPAETTDCSGDRAGSCACHS